MAGMPVWHANVHTAQYNRNKLLQDCFYAADAGRNRLFFLNFKDTRLGNLCCMFHMRPAAELDRKCVVKRPNRVHRNAVWILSAKLVLGTQFLCLFFCHLGANNRQVFVNLFVYYPLYLFFLLVGHLCSPTKVDTQALLCNIRAALVYLSTQYLLKCFK